MKQKSVTVGWLLVAFALTVVLWRALVPKRKREIRWWERPADSGPGTPAGQRWWDELDSPKQPKREVPAEQRWWDA